MFEIDLKFEAFTQVLWPEHNFGLFNVRVNVFRDMTGHYVEYVVKLVFYLDNTPCSCRTRMCTCKGRRMIWYSNSHHGKEYAIRRGFDMLLALHNYAHFLKHESKTG